MRFHLIGIPMTLRPALLAAPLALLPVFSRAAEAPVLRDRYTVRAGGVERAYALALDEAGATDAAGARRKVALRARTAPEAGEYVIRVRSYGPGETGEYVLTLEPSSAG